MALLNQVFKLGETIYTSKQEFQTILPTDSKSVANEKKAENRKIINAQKNIGKQTSLTILSAVGFTYNTYISVARFGQRGQDIQDQNNVQDKLFGTSLGLASAFVVGGPVGFAVAGALTGFNEMMSVIKQNALYEYKRQVDIDQKAVVRERMGEIAYNSSRRGYV